MHKHITTKEISGEWERGNFLVFSKGHLPHLPCEGVHLLPYPHLQEVNRFLFWSFGMLSYCV